MFILLLTMIWYFLAAVRNIQSSTVELQALNMRRFKNQSSGHEDDFLTLAGPAPGENELEHVNVEPQFDLILGEFKHYQDEHFDEYLELSGLGYMTRSAVSSSEPKVIIVKYLPDDYYFYEDADYVDDDNPDHGEESEYQLVVTTEMWFTTTVDRFRLGRTFKTEDYDGTSSLNTYYFSKPNILVHKKVKDIGTNYLIRKFDDKGFVLILKSGNSDLVARRWYRRLSKED